MADSKISALPASTTPLAGTEVLPIVQSSTTKQVSVANLTAGRGISVTTLTTTAANATASTGGGTGAGYSYITNTGGQLYFGVTSSTGTGLGSSFNNYSSALTTFNATDLGLGTNAVNRLNIGSTGDVTVVSGNLVIGTSGKGIDFSANTQAAGMTSELLNWYEEGTWTPTVNGSTTAGTANYLVQNAYYTRVGRQVTANFYVRWDTGTGTGSMQVGGLPFTSKNSSGFYYSGSVSNVSVAFTVGNTVGLFLGHNTTKLELVQISGATGQTNVPYSAGAIIIGQITYFV